MVPFSDPAPFGWQVAQALPDVPSIVSLQSLSAISMSLAESVIMFFLMGIGLMAHGFLAMQGFFAQGFLSFASAPAIRPEAAIATTARDIFNTVLLIVSIHPPLVCCESLLKSRHCSHLGTISEKKQTGAELWRFIRQGESYRVVERYGQIFWEFFCSGLSFQRGRKSLPL